MPNTFFDLPLAEILGEKPAKSIKRAFGYTTAGQLLAHYPRRYVVRGELTTIDSLPLGEPVTLFAEVLQTTKRDMHGRRGSIVETVLTDGHGTLTLTFFNQPWREHELMPGERGVFSGKITRYRDQLQLAHPDFELFDKEQSEADAEAWAKRPIPMYPATASLPSWRIQKLMAEVLEHATDAQLDAGDPLDTQAKHALKCGSYASTLRRIHEPAEEQDFRVARAGLVAREAYVLQAALLNTKLNNERQAAVPRLVSPGGLVTQFTHQLPFAFTDDQETASEAILSDMRRSYPMNRLVQGEVGSGKTVVALVGMLATVDGGGQSALLAPTEVLARQHYETIVRMLGPDLAAKVNPVLITGSMKTSERKRATLQVAAGQAGIVVGTHALLSDKTMFFDLGLIVIDEQHRFGVKQREQLRRKAKLAPHVLMLTATPIPRTVAMSVFGDLDISSIHQLPEGRQRIDTFVVALADHPKWIARVWQRVAEEVAHGRQAYVVCALITPADDDAAAETLPAPLSVTEVYARLQAHLQIGKLRLGTLHGQMSGDEKAETMSAFAAGDIDVLIATTVVEVGVNVPNATVMVVMDADRFGIAQLHQLRGRVGRGEHASVALLVTNADADSEARERLDAVAGTRNGFELAELDLEHRREGDVLGANQSGSSSLKLLRVIKDKNTIANAREAAASTMDEDPQLADHSVLRAAIAGAVDSDQQQYMVSA